jgi:hypothetical protein
VIEFYSRLAGRCGTINQLNRVHVALEQRMTPCELVDLRSDLRRRGWAAQNTIRLRDVTQLANLPKKAYRLLTGSRKTDPADKTVAWTRPITDIERLGWSKGWIDGLYGKYALAGTASPEPFVRRRLRRAVWMFKSDGDQRQKRLLICFSGNTQRLMMPIPVFLQHVDARTTDIAYLQTERHAGYRKGIRGVANDLDASIAALEGLLRLHEYDRVATLGTSGGALPAILAGLRWGVDAVLSAGPNDPNDVRWTRFMQGRGTSDLFRHFAKDSAKIPEIYLVCGAESPRDVAAATAIASSIQIRDFRSVPHAKHGALFSLVQRRQFGDLLRSTVFNCSTARTAICRAN